MKSPTFKTLFITIFVTVYYFFPSISTGQSVKSKLHSGVIKYQQKNYKDAISLFQEAREEIPNDANLAYNLANSYYKSGNYIEALQNYNQTYTSSKSLELKQKAIYNIGNSFFRMGKLEKALQAYKKSLEINSNDMEAKFNLEFTREQIKKRQQKKNQNQKHKSKQTTQNNNKNLNKNDLPKDTDRSNKSNQNKSKDQSIQETKKDVKTNSSNKFKADANQNKNEQAPYQPEQAQQIDSNEMTKQEADQWLRALKENPKLLGLAQSSQRGRNPPYLGKDW